MALIDNLADHRMTASSLIANQPSDNRVVVVQDDIHGLIITVNVRFQSGHWVGATSFKPIEFSHDAIWSESYQHQELSAPIL